VLERAVRDRPRTPAVGALLCVVVGLALLLAAPAAGQADGEVVRTEVSGVITPLTQDHLASVIERAEVAGRQAVVVELDTPGGSLDATRAIVRDLLAAPVPVIVHVTPRGADAGSAGTFITYAAHVAAMTPATTIGAATPVDLEGQEVGDKIVENTVAFGQAIAEERGRDTDFVVAAVRDGRSVTAEVALEEGAIDLIADDLGDLLAAVDGTQVELDTGTQTLRTADAQVVDDIPTATQRFLQVLADPNLAFIFLSLGSLAILYEIANPGLGLGGVVGVVSLVLAMFSLSVLPVSMVGLILMVVAAVMFVAELFIPGIGVGAAGGTGALVLGGLFLFQAESGVGIDWWVLIPTALVAFGTTAFAGVMAARSRKVRPVKGSDDLVGHEGTVQGTGTEHPHIRVYGSYWRVRPRDTRPRSATWTSTAS
jgi:membrane-bound serine protease (ClpP class)